MSALRAAAGLALLLSAPAAARSPEDDVRAVIAAWYGELLEKEKGRHWSLAAPGFIDATPPYDHVDTGARNLGPRIYTSLAARAMKFGYDIDRIRLDPNFAKVQVWERGYFYAWAAQKTYEAGASTTFVLERGEADGRWRILAHQSTSQGIPPNKVTDPMPDLRDLYYSTEGKHRDPAADARSARNF